MFILTCNRFIIISYFLYAEKSSSVNDKSPPQPPPRWTKPAHCAVTSQSSFNISTDTSKINLINSVRILIA